MVNTVSLVGHAQAGTVARKALLINARAQAMVDMAGAAQKLLTQVVLVGVVALPCAIQYQASTCHSEAGQCQQLN